MFISQKTLYWSKYIKFVEGNLKKKNARQTMISNETSGSKTNPLESVC